MDEEKVKEYYQLMNMYESALYGLKWLQNTGEGRYESLITQLDFLHKELLRFGINNIGIKNNIDHNDHQDS